MRFRRVHIPVIFNNKPPEGDQTENNLLLINAIDFLLINAAGDKLRIA